MIKAKSIGKTITSRIGTRWATTGPETNPPKGPLVPQETGKTELEENPKQLVTVVQRDRLLRKNSDPFLLCSPNGAIQLLTLWSKSHISMLPCSLLPSFSSWTPAPKMRHKASRGPCKRLCSSGLQLKVTWPQR